MHLYCQSLLFILAIVFIEITVITTTKQPTEATWNLLSLWEANGITKITTLLQTKKNLANAGMSLTQDMQLFGS